MWPKKGEVENKKPETIASWDGYQEEKNAASGWSAHGFHPQFIREKCARILICPENRSLPPNINDNCFLILLSSPRIKNAHQNYYIFFSLANNGAFARIKWL